MRRSRTIPGAESIPDPVDVANYLDFLATRTTNDEARRLLHYAARYILAGLELAHEYLEDE